eukprot:TRINITY_DN3555_c0_g2_i1.p1 TRINITY_DN3555_c0_g2~~TRINITY_DN3555_c0_g2_i1.p1  ORF type:complete len:172 (+),score=51.40 TRINITY_DN3555_c0_g2_i1:19-534(+)
MVDEILTNTLAVAAISVDGSHGTLSLDQLDNHDTIEHDASMTRDDLYFGDNHSLNKTLLSALIASSSDGGQTISLDDFANYQSVRQNNSKAYNPEFTFGGKQQTASAGEPALFLNVFGMQDESGMWRVPVDSVESVFGNERLPEGWNATNSVGVLSIGKLSAEIHSKWTSL